MVHSLRYRFIYLLTVFLVTGTMLSACAKKSAPKPAGTEVGKEQASGRETPGPTTVSPEQKKNLEELAKKIDNQSGSDIGSKSIEAATSRHAVTADELKTLKKYGTFMYPDATLVAEKSFSQTFTEGTEIYKLEFGVSVGTDKVIKWYKSNLEAAIRTSSGTLGDGSTYTGFEYESGDGSWFKNITVKGFPGQSSCTISVNLNNKGKPPEKSKPVEKP
jgi:hypothetical protein